MSAPNIDNVIYFLTSLQDAICSVISAEDGEAKFEEDSWKRPAGGVDVRECYETALSLSKQG